MGKEKMYYEQLGYDFDAPFYRAKDKPVVTNADRIRSMSDEELAELLVSTDGDFPPNCEDVPVHKLEAYWLDWLKQEAEGGE